MDIEIVELDKKIDQRGFLIEFLKKNELMKDQLFGQIYCCTIQPGTIRGNHYHQKKPEWMGILNGEIKLNLEDVSTKEKKEILINANENIYRVRIGTNIAHCVKNIGPNLVILIAYTSKEYNPLTPDTIAYKVG